MCAALILSSVPVLNFTLFGTEAKAATYTKQHTKEYYYAPGTQFIAYLATGGGQDGTTAKKIVTDSGYTLIDKNLNAGVRVFPDYFPPEPPTRFISATRRATILPYRFVTSE